MSRQCVHMGTSGWVYKHWQGRFYPSDLPAANRLAYYASQLDTLEINNSFYGLPTPEAFSAWQASTPDDFLFAVMGNRFITHMIQLCDPAPLVADFMPRAEHLDETPGPILWQLPPRWHRTIQRLAEFLQTLPTSARRAFELGDATWCYPSIYDCLKHYNAAFCIYDFAAQQSPLEGTADWLYMRFHGPTGRYAGSCDDAVLEQWAKTIRGWLDRSLEVYCYFNNDDRAYAIANSRTLLSIIEM